MAKNFDLIWAREHAGLSQVQAAKVLTEAGLATTPNTICRWETGATHIPRRKWSKVLEAFKMTQADIPKLYSSTPPPAATPSAPALVTRHDGDDSHDVLNDRRTGKRRRRPVLDGEPFSGRRRPTQGGWERFLATGATNRRVKATRRVFISAAMRAALAAEAAAYDEDDDPAT